MSQDQGFHNTKNPTDSLISAKERRERLRAQMEQEAAAKGEAEAKRKERDAKEFAEETKRSEEYIKRTDIISDEETREHLLQRIRDMREAPAERPLPKVVLTESMKQQLSDEQECGRRAVAKAEGEMAIARELRAKYERAQADAATELERAKRQARAVDEGTMTPVVHPNPTMDERFPVSKSTIDPGGRVLRR